MAGSGFLRRQIPLVSTHRYIPCFSAHQQTPLHSPRRHIVSSHLPPVTLPNSNYIVELHRAAHGYPNRKAIIDGVTNDSFTYSELRRATRSVASGLLKLGFSTGSYLVLVLQNCPEFVLAAHGAVAAGGIAAPLNCYSTASELRQPMALSNASMVVTDRERLANVRQALPSTAPTVVLIRESKRSAKDLGCLSFDSLLDDDGTALGDDFVAVDADNDLAFLPFSSGTTGLPKGVMLTHNNVGVNLRQMEASLLNPRATEVALGVLPFYHIYALNAVIGNTLHTGGSLVTLPRFKPEQFLKAIDEHDVSTLHLVPPLLLFLIQSPLVDQFKLSTVLRVMSGAAPLGLDVEKQVDDKVAQFSPQAQFFQSYGMTETSPFTHANFMHTDEERQSKRLGCVGRHVGGMECKIIDTETREELSPGEFGELAMRGPNVMAGYLRNPEATKSSIDEDGWYHTGDIGSFDNDGYFYITDRVKELIKYKGFQVAPAEVESVLLIHPKVLDCAVVGKKDDRAGELPFAFIVPNSDNLQDNDIHDHLGSLLSDYKQLRGGMELVKEIPKSPSGKILRRQLREMIN